MFQKFAPLLVLTMFAIGVYYMLQGMQGAIDMADPKKAQQSEEVKEK